MREGLEKYSLIQNQFKLSSTICLTSEFQRQFNGFYRVRRNAEWRKSYFELLAYTANQSHPTFRNVILAIQNKTSRIEASFASKLIATVNPNLPVIDRFVVKNIGLKLPNYNNSSRIDLLVNLYEQLTTQFEHYLLSPEGETLTSEFDKFYPNAAITNIKKLDLVLWQIR